METMEQLKSELALRIPGLEDEIKRYKGSFAEDFVYAFEWYAEPMYKSEMELRALRKIAEKAETMSADEIAVMLDEWIERMEDDLLDGTLQGKSTSETKNISHTWNLEEEQRLRAMFVRWKKDIAEVKKIEKG